VLAIAAPAEPVASNLDNSKVRRIEVGDSPDNFERDHIRSGVIN